jgi:uncharacterized protein (DUF697 family)
MLGWLRAYSALRTQGLQGLTARVGASADANKEGIKAMEDREIRARSTVKKYMWISGGVGLVPLPFLNLAGITALQLRMLQVLSEMYDVPFSKDLGKKIIGALLGSVAPASASGIVGRAATLFASSMQGVRMVGGIVGRTTMPVFAGASTYALGKVFIQHFESGGTFLDFEPAKVRAYFKQQFTRGRDLSTERREEPGPIDRTSPAEI